MKKIYVLFMNILITSIVFCGSGKGDLDITLNLTPFSTTKKYNVDRSVLLDVGDFNSKSLINEKKIADVTVDIQARKSENGNGNDICIIDGDFNGLYYLDKLAEKNNNQEIKTSDLVNYYSENKVGMKLTQRNFQIKIMNVENRGSTQDKYSFSAYADTESCKGRKNLVTKFQYTFEIWLEVTGARPGDILRKDVNISNGKATEEAVGALKDLVKEQIERLK